MDPNAQPAPMAPPSLPSLPLQQTRASLPLPTGADLAFWRGEIDRANEEQKKHHADWQSGIDRYAGKAPTNVKYSADPDWVNVNVDFYQVEQKKALLFYDTPELQVRGTGPLKGRDDIAQAHRELINELLDECEILDRAVLPAITDCLAASGTGPVVVGYQPTLREITPPAQPGSVLGLVGSVKVPIHQQWYALRFSPKKLLIPADFTDTTWDLAPWLGMRFRMALTVAKREFPDAFATQPDFKGTTTRDEYVLDESSRGGDSSGQSYVDGVMIFYKAASFDEQVSHPELYRELVIIDGLDDVARHRDNPHQTLLPNGQLSADSMIGNPIHPLSIRFVPDSAYTPSDSQMTGPLVNELCVFRTQMIQRRDADRPFNLYDIGKLPPETIAKIENRTIGSMIGVEEGALAQGAATIIASAVSGGRNREDYTASDYITRDIEKTLAIDAAGAGVTADISESATKTSVVDRNRQTRLDAERRQVLRWYLNLIDKFSALVCRYMTPQMAAQYIGPQQAQVWAQWDKKSTSGRVAFSAKPDSQIRLDAAQERRAALQLYQFCANDPNVNRVPLLRHVMSLFGLNPQETVVDQLPEKKPEPRISYTFNGQDFVGPQAPIVLQILAQNGVQISQDAVDTSAGLMFKQVALGLRDASGAPVPTAVKRLAEHGGPAEQVRPLSKQQGDETGNRPGPSMEAA